MHLRNCVDFHNFDSATPFLDASSYFRFRDECIQSANGGNAALINLVVDYFIASVVGLYSYSRGSQLYRFFCENDEMTPDQNYSKNAQQFYFNNGEIKRHLKELRKYVKKNYISRYGYLSNLITHEVIGNNVERKVPQWKTKLVDRSDANKALAAVRE